ncbi:hypothetical protein MMC22_009271 [Lobaria immixta]|nr:hypothetical protein [Lobaria immixta]
MKSISILLAIGLIASAQAQEACDAIAAEIPSCASTCIVSAASAVGCAKGDYKCQCGDKSAAIAESALPCVVEGCGAVTGLAVQSSAGAVCGCAATAAAAPASTTAAVETPTSKAVVSSPPVASSTPEETSAVTTSAATTSKPVASITPPFPTTSAAATAPAPSGTASGGTTPVSPSGSTGSTIPFPGAAAGRTIGSVAAVLGGLFAAILVL